MLPVDVIVEPPSEDELRRAGVQSLEVRYDTSFVLKAATEKLDCGTEPTSSLQLNVPMMTVTAGLPVLAKKLVAKILANENYQQREGRAGQCRMAWRGKS